MCHGVRSAVPGVFSYSSGPRNPSAEALARTRAGPGGAMPCAGRSRGIRRWCSRALLVRQRNSQGDYPVARTRKTPPAAVKEDRHGGVINSHPHRGMSKSGDRATASSEEVGNRCLTGVLAGIGFPGILSPGQKFGRRLGRSEAQRGSLPVAPPAGQSAWEVAGSSTCSTAPVTMP